MLYVFFRVNNIMAYIFIELLGMVKMEISSALSEQNDKDQSK